MVIYMPDKISFGLLTFSLEVIFSMKSQIVKEMISVQALVDVFSQFSARKGLTAEMLS